MPRAEPARSAHGRLRRPVQDGYAREPRALLARLAACTSLAGAAVAAAAGRRDRPGAAAAGATARRRARPAARRDRPALPAAARPAGRGAGPRCCRWRAGALLRRIRAGSAAALLAAALAARSRTWSSRSCPGGGLGLGDVKLAAVLALILGFAGWPAVVVGLRRAAPDQRPGGAVPAAHPPGRPADRPLPFGPALLAGALIGLTCA